MSRPASPPQPGHGIRSGPVIAVGLVIGLILVTLAYQEALFAGHDDAELLIHINGVETQMARDVLLPNTGWVLEIELPAGLAQEVRDTLKVTLRAERTGSMIEIVDQLVQRKDLATLVIPESLGLFAGLLSIRATLTDLEGGEIEAYRRVRIRRWLGGPPIGSREIIHFDFSVDRDANGRPDFESDLQSLGLLAPAQPELARAISQRLAERALARVERAYDRRDDPNRTGLPRDQVFIRFMLETDPGPFVTRICVGGANQDHPESIGYVRFDHRNARKSSNECDPKRPGAETNDEREAAGLFPREFSIYRDSPLYREVFGPFLSKQGGTPIGADPLDLQAVAGVGAEALDLHAVAGGAGAGSPIQRDALLNRRADIDRVIEVFGDALGTVMAHEAAHALGLVPKGKPGVGLFGGDEALGEGYAHNLLPSGNPPSQKWLMNNGHEFRFEDLAGEAEAGELRFRPLNYAYLKDRVVLIDGRD
jgi:hypothetical protein